MPAETPRDLAAEAKKLPRADRLLAAADRAGFVARLGHAPVMAQVRAALEGARERVLAGEACPAPEALEGTLLARLAGEARGSLRRVVNATGVVIHTNLGRSPLSEAAREAMRAAAGYLALEYDLAAGERGDRYGHAGEALCRLTGAEAALVVNNNAAAVLLSLSALAKGKAVLISRGQLVEIGGGFRVPDVMRQSGAKLVEVGTTNRTHIQDFRAALDAKTALILHAHSSNFKIIGFATEPSMAELCELGVPVMDDLGSGALLDTADFGLAHEPMVTQSLQAGASLVMFSGDKLLGGPQAGVIVGQRELIAKLMKHPLARAIRADKLCLAALSATLLHYLKHEALREIPVWRMLAMPLAEIEARAQRWAARLGGEVVAGESTVGGGSLPGETLPTRLVALNVRSPNAFAARLRAQNPPVIAVVAQGQVRLDPRTVAPVEEEVLLQAVRRLLDQ
jgi:L-seryl-tRNA(Ser) seleniumtransferase